MNFRGRTSSCSSPTGRNTSRPGAKTYYTQIRIDPLPAENARTFLGALLGEHDALDPLKRLLIERTECNPFFLEAPGP